MRKPLGTTSSATTRSYIRQHIKLPINRMKWFYLLVLMFFIVVVLDLQKRILGGDGTVVPPTKARPARCSVPRPTTTAKSRAGLQTLTPGHSNCTLGWRENPSVNFGQNLEDAIIYHRFFSGRSPLAHLGRSNGAGGGDVGSVEEKRGFFLEMGALDGITFSNTLLFEQCLGWDGLLVEAQPENFSLLQQNRPCSITIGEAACSYEDGPTIHMSGKAGTAMVINNQASGGDADSTEVPCRPLSDMFEEHGIKRINFFSLDVEGAELKVLETINWNKVKIDVLMVEAEFVSTAHKIDGLDDKIEAVRNLVTTKGGMVQVRSRLDQKDPATGEEQDVRLCERNGYNDKKNCMFLSIAGSDVFVSPEMYEYDTKPWLFGDRA